jgi:hypothetical protein
MLPIEEGLKDVEEGVQLAVKNFGQNMATNYAVIWPKKAESDLEAAIHFILLVWNKKKPKNL